jgi:hypothetical protein
VAVADVKVIRRGRYVCDRHDGQPPIVVENTGAPEGADYHGPWITYRLDFEPEGSGQPVLVTVFRALLEYGYRLDETAP